MANSLVSGVRTLPPGDIRIRELAEAATALDKAAAAVRSREGAARDAERSKDEFLAILGHELRNPLAALRGAAYLLRQRWPRTAPPPTPSITVRARSST